MEIRDRVVNMDQVRSTSPYHCLLSRVLCGTPCALLYALGPLSCAILSSITQTRTFLIAVVFVIQKRILDLRKKNTASGNPDAYQNISVEWTNAMRYMANYFYKGQVSQPEEWELRFRVVCFFFKHTLS